MFSIHIFCFSLLIIFCRRLTAGPSQYELDPKCDYPVIGVGITGAGLAFFKEREIASHYIDSESFKIWEGALGTTTTVGALRVASGKHFPSDVLDGATVGSVVG